VTRIRFFRYARFFTLIRSSSEIIPAMNLYIMYLYLKALDRNESIEKILELEILLSRYKYLLINLLNFVISLQFTITYFRVHKNYNARILMSSSVRKLISKQKK
jgi:hypothetical protein